MKTTTIKKYVTLVLILQILAIGIQAWLISKGSNVGVNASFLAVNLLFGMVNIHTLISIS